MKKRRFFTILAIILIIIGAALAGIFTKKIKINFLFTDSYIKGVDVSHYQGTIDMEKLEQQGISFIFIKATEGSEGVDERFAINWENASETQMLMGAYHFFSFDSGGEQQAHHFIDTVGDLRGRLVPVVDVEFYGDKEKNPPAAEEVIEELTAYLTVLEKEYQVVPIIYTTRKVYRKYIRDSFKKYPLWLRNVYYPVTIDAGNRWSFWQYSDTECLEGYKGDEKYIDMNVFQASKEELQEMLISY